MMDFGIDHSSKKLIYGNYLRPELLVNIANYNIIVHLDERNAVLHELSLDTGYLLLTAI